MVPLDGMSISTHAGVFDSIMTGRGVSTGDCGASTGACWAVAGAAHSHDVTHTSNRT